MFIPNSQYRRLNLQGQHLLIATNPNPPMFYGEYDSESGHFNATHGMDVSFISVMRTYFNFTYDILDMQGAWGLEPKEEGGVTFDGLLGAVISGNATFGMGAVSIRLVYGKERLIEFTTPNLSSRITFLTLESPRAPLTGVLLRPFSLSGWAIVLLLVASMLLTGRLITAISRWPPPPVSYDWLALAALLQKAPRMTGRAAQSEWTAAKQSVAASLLLQLAWFGGFILLSAYGGVLISFLTRSFKLQNLDTLQAFKELVVAGNITPLLVSSSTFVYDFKRYINISATFRVILEKMEEVDTYREGFYKISREAIYHPERTYALVGQYLVMKKWAEQLGEAYFHMETDADSSIFTDDYGLVFPYGSNLTVHFDRFIRIATEAGFFVKWSSQQYRWTTKRREIQKKMKQVMSRFQYDTEERHFSYDQLELVHIDEHFYLLFIGAALSLVVLIGEVAQLLYSTRRGEK